MSQSIMDTILPISTAEYIAAKIEFPDYIIETFAPKIIYNNFFSPVLNIFESFAKYQFPELDSWVSQMESQRHIFANKLPLLHFWTVIFALICYFAITFLLLIISKIIGKGKYKLLVITHNLFLYLLSFYMSFAILVSVRAANYTLWNNNIGESYKDWRIAKLIWLFYISKIPEWMDTFIMCLKQNTHQITFLHLYHHSTIFFIWYICCIIAPGGEAYWSAFINSSIHVIMYGYYLLTTLFETGKIRNILNKFKFLITKLQMIQFTINCIQSVYDLYVIPRESLRYNVGLLYLLFVYMITLLILFGNFLMKAPKRTTMKSKKINKEKENNKKISNDSNGKSIINNNTHNNNNNNNTHNNKHNNKHKKAYEIKELPVFKDFQSRGSTKENNAKKKNK